MIYLIILVVLKKKCIFAKKIRAMKPVFSNLVRVCSPERYDVFKRLLPLWASVLFLMPTLSAQSSWESQVERYGGGHTGRSLIVRTESNNTVVMCSRTLQWTGTHTFMRRGLIGGTDGFTCNLSSLLTDSTSTFVVKDMYNFNDTCYFCGFISVKECEPFYDNEGNVVYTGWYSQGVVGLFDLRDLNMSTVALQLLRVGEVDSLTHLVVHRDDPTSGPLIMAVGRSSMYSPTSCVVELQPYSGIAAGPNIWTKRIVQPTCADEEYFTDIILTDSYVEVVSKLPYYGGVEDPNHYIFRLHETKRDGFYTMSANPGIPASVAQYSVHGPGVFIGTHQADEPISLCTMYGDRFCVTYGEEGYNGTGGPIVLRMNSSLTMEKALWMDYHRHCHVRDVAYLKDLDVVAILTLEDDYWPGGIVRLPKWTAANDLDPMYWQGKRLWSIDCIMGQKVVAGGTYADNTMFQTIYDPGLYYINFDTLCVDTHWDLFELFSESQPTIMDCGWIILRDWNITGQIFDIPVRVYNSYSDCLVDENQ